MKMSKKHRKRRNGVRRGNGKERCRGRGSNIKYRTESASVAAIGLYINVLNIFINAYLQLCIYIYMILKLIAISLGS